METPVWRRGTVGGGTLKPSFFAHLAGHQFGVLYLVLILSPCERQVWCEQSPDFFSFGKFYLKSIFTLRLLPPSSILLEAAESASVRQDGNRSRSHYIKLIALLMMAEGPKSDSCRRKTRTTTDKINDFIIFSIVYYYYYLMLDIFLKFLSILL